MERTKVPEGRQNVHDGPDWVKRLCRLSGTSGPFRYRQPSTKVLGYFQGPSGTKRGNRPLVPPSAASLN